MNLLGVELDLSERRRWSFARAGQQRPAELLGLKVVRRLLLLPVV